MKDEMRDVEEKGRADKRDEPPATGAEAPSHTQPETRRNADTDDALSGNGEGSLLDGDRSRDLAMASRVATIGLFIIALLAVVVAAQAIVVPIVLAWAVGTILIPVVELLRRLKAPPVVAAIVASLGLLSVIGSVLALLVVPMTTWIGRASELGRLIREKLALLSEPLKFIREIAAAVREATGAAPATGGDGGGGGGSSTIDQAATLAQTAASYLTPAAAETLLFIGALVFFLTYRDVIKRSLVMFMPDRALRLKMVRILAETESNMTVYFSTVSLVNVIVGMLTGVASWAVGLPNPLLWAVLATVLNFVPYVGAILTFLALFGAGLFVFPTLLGAMLAPALFAVIATIEGQVITPALLGKRLSLNPFLVFLAIGFWSWMWGPIGSFLAVPLLLSAVVVWRHITPDDRVTLPE
ncbi:MAG: AI-2E family transporter [Hyphomicrobiaceae bacterium]